MITWILIQLCVVLVGLIGYVGVKWISTLGRESHLKAQVEYLRTHVRELRRTNITLMQAS